MLLTIYLAIVLCLGSGLILTAVYLLAMEPILTFFGGKVNAETCSTKFRTGFLTIQVCLSESLKPFDFPAFPAGLLP